MAQTRSLTGESTPAGDVAGSPVGEDDAPVWHAGGHQRVGEGDGGGQLDQRDVVTAKEETHTPSLISTDKIDMVNAHSTGQRFE